ncbi:MAG TPA: biotin/lipoyl-binding protein, partial [Isosphaeraceae bacterium]|nr:biotin/lipoyl-binding protein [Isosphaeraceae bacterium]
MTARFLMRLVLLATGLLLTTAFVVQSGTLGKIPPAWTATGIQPAARPAERGHAGTSKPSAASNVIAEGRVVAYPGAEVVVGTEAAGRIVHLEIQEKSVVRKGDLIAELNAEDLKADHALASARIMEAEADIRFFDR